MKHHSSTLIASLAVAATLVSGPVLSQVLEEIIVTATKREENMQQVSVVVTAFSQDALNRIGANNIERLDALTPGLEWGQLGHSAKISIRGQSVANSESNADSAVALFVDGVYLGRGMQVWQTATDIERIEVLRGPQGTLFGRNASGGSVNIISNKPGREKEARFEVIAGDYDLLSVNGHFNTPMGDNWAGRLTFLTEEHDGFLENMSDPNNSQMDEDMWYLRGALRYDNGPLTVDISLDYYDQTGNGNGFSGAKFFDEVNLALNTFACTLPGLPPSFIPAGCPGLPVNTENDWEIELNRSFRDTENTTATLTFDYDFATTNLKSITAYSDFSQIAGGDTDFTDQWLLDCRLVTDATIFSQEFQLSSTGDEKLNWMVGLYYLDEEIVESFILVLPFGAPLGEEPEPTFDPISEFRGNDRRGTINTKSTAIFGQLTYRFNDQLGLTVGARYTEDDRDYVSTELALMNPRGEIDVAEVFSEPTWKVGLDYRIDDSRMVYATISTGYKAGTFNRFAPPEPPIPGGVDYELVVRPETIINYEIGFKGDLLDNTLRANVTAFYNEIDDFQSYAFDDSLPSSITANAATAKTEGAELELTWLPSEPAQINVVVAYLDAYYDEYATFTNGANFIDASGNKRELSPEWKYTLAGSYEFDLGSAGTLTPYVQYTYKDDYFITAANNLLGQDHQRSYGQTDIRVIWNSLERHWRGELFLTNIEDNFPKVGAYLATGGYWITYGPEPTIFGAKLAYTF